MTILVTYKTKDKIYMGCDTQVTGGVTEFCKDKWHKVMINDNDYVMIGCTGYAKFGDFFRHGFKPPHYYKENDFVDYLHNQLAPAITKALTKRKITKEKDGNLQTESEFVVVYDEVYTLIEDAAPYQQSEVFMATGSGYRLAYGAYYATCANNIKSAVYLDDDKAIKDMIGDCIDAAKCYDPYCGGEQVIHVMERAK